MMPIDLDDVCCASLPPPSLAVLADLRARGGITVTLAGGRAWVRWEPGDEAVLSRVFPVPGAELFARRDGLWYRPGRHLPSFGLPVDADEAAVPLHRAIFPQPIRATAPDEAAPTPARLRLVRDDRERAASALRCGLEDLAAWAELATSAQLGASRAARAGDQVMLIGRPLPPIGGGERFWGTLVLVPLGFQAEPALPEPALRRALGVGDGEVLVLEADGFEAVPREAFRPLSRAGVRLAREGRAP
jgi:hypothetical protein